MENTLANENTDYVERCDRTQNLFVDLTEDEELERILCEIEASWKQGA